MRARSGLAGVAVIGALGIGLLGPRDGEAQLQGFSGNLRSSVSYDEQRVGGIATRRAESQHDYSLGVQGLIVDPRLATFDVTGTFAGTDALLGQVQGNRIVSGGLNLNILPFSRIPLGLRHFQAHGWNGTTSDVMSSSLAWRVSHPLYPTLSLNVDRTAVRTSGLFPSDTSFLNGTIRSNYRLEDLDLFGEVGARHTEDLVRRTSTTSQFANFSGTYTPSTATNVQGTANYFQEAERLSAGVNVSLINRPDASLTRSVNASVRANRDGGISTYSLDAAGSVTKNYLLAPNLQTFLTGGASFAADVVDARPVSTTVLPGQGPGAGFLSLTVNGGGGVTYSGLRYVVAAADSTLAALYEDDAQRGFGARGTFHLGLTGRNLDPLTAGADYTFRAETGVVDSRDHTLSFRANIAAPIRPTLRLEAFAQSGMFLRETGGVSAGPGSSVSLTGGGRATYTGIPFVTWNLVSQYQFAKSGLFQTERVLTSTILTYTPFGRLQATLTANREDILTTTETRHSVQADVSYRIGATLVNLTYSLDVLSGRGVSPLFQRVMLTWTRPIGRRFR